MDTLLLIGTVTLGTPLVAGAIIALGSALEPSEETGETFAEAADA